MKLFTQTTLFKAGSLALFSVFFSCQNEIENNSLNEEANIIDSLGNNINSTEIDREIVTIEYFNELIEVEKINDQYFFEGDIIVVPDSKYKRNGNVAAKGASVGRTTGFWENNTVYYSIDEDLNYQYRIFDAIEHWEENTSIRFEEKTSTTLDYVTFVSGFGCSSYVGKIGGEQYITLEDACSTGNVIHEIGHAIGLWHEQSRKDRDDYITIHYDNIEAGLEHNFKTYEEQWRDGDEYTDFFDFESIMMYHPYSFSHNGLPTITTVSGNVNYGYQSTRLSDGDIEGVLKMYPQQQEITGVMLPEIKNPTFSENRVYKNNDSSTCSCVSWYNSNFPKQPATSTDSNDDVGNEGGGSIKLTFGDDENHRVAYQLLDNVTPGITYELTFYYSINNGSNPGELDFRILTPNVESIDDVNNSNTIAQFIGEQTDNTSSIKAVDGGGQIAKVTFISSTNQVALYAVNSIPDGTDVRIDNFSIAIKN